MINPFNFLLGSIHKSGYLWRGKPKSPKIILNNLCVVLFQRAASNELSSSSGGVYTLYF